MRTVAAAMAALILTFGAPVAAQSSFDQFIQSLWPEARELGVSRRTVESHLYHAYAKLDVSSRVELGVAAVYTPKDFQLNRILLQIGTEEVRLRNLSDGREVPAKQLEEILALLETLDKHATYIKRLGGDFADYVEKRSKDGTLPQFMIKVREGNDETVHYFLSTDEVDDFKSANNDLFGSDTEVVERKKEGPTRRAKVSDLHLESKAIADLLGKLNRKGLAVDHYAAQDKPLFELVEGEGERATVTPLFSIPEILAGVKTVGKKGIQMYRFKGLGEMDAKELFETTMNPAKRKLLRIDLTDAVEAEEMFVKLMGDEVEPRRQFIEDNALNVRNLDV